ncbi:hypothetical protein E2320_012916, partial [Naja naja]
ACGHTHVWTDQAGNWHAGRRGGVEAGEARPRRHCGCLEGGGSALVPRPPHRRLSAVRLRRGAVAGLLRGTLSLCCFGRAETALHVSCPRVHTTGPSPSSLGRGGPAAEGAPESRVLPRAPAAAPPLGRASMFAGAPLLLVALSLAAHPVHGVSLPNEDQEGGRARESSRAARGVTSKPPPHLGRNPARATWPPGPLRAGGIRGLLRRKGE